MEKEEIIALEKHAQEVRRKILNMGYEAQCGHLAPGLSCTDILVALYDKILNFDPKNPKWEGRDRFGLSKGHGCMPLYVLLSEKGFFPDWHLGTFVQPGSMLSCHADRMVPGIEMTTGSLGLGVGQMAGRAYALKKLKKNDSIKVFTLLGDGECQEGTVWEALMFAGDPKNKLDNFTVIIDNNGFGAVQKLDTTVSSIEPFKPKLESFGFSVREINGHDFNEILPALQEVPYEKGKPSAIIAHTIKGKGVSYMENNPLWHHRPPNNEEYKQAIKELSKENGIIAPQIMKNINKQLRN